LENLKGRDNLGDLSWEDNIKMDVVVDQIHISQDRDQWQALVKTVVNLQVPWKAGYFLTV
jgi:hypothetical protein